MTADEADATHVPATWEADVRITNDAANSLTAGNWTRDVAVTSDGAVHLAWYDTRDGVPQIYAARSLDGGTTWEAATRVAPAASSQELPAIAASGAHVYVAWHEQRATGFVVVTSRSIDGGATWQAPLAVSAGPGDAFASLAADGDDVHLVFVKNAATAEVMYAQSTDGGASFSAPVQLSPAADAHSWVPGITAAGARVVTSWVDYQDANEEEYLRISNDHGATWGPVTRLTADPGDSWAPSVAIAGDTIHLSWFDRRDAPYNDVQVEDYLDAIGAMMGLALPPAPPRTAEHYYLDDFAQRLQQKQQAIVNAAPQWVMNGGDETVLTGALAEFQRRFIAWNVGWEIYYKRSLDGGVTWTADTRITNASYLSQRPSIVAVGDRVDMVWFDGRDGSGMDDADAQIYASHSDDGGATWGANERLTTAAGGARLASLATDGTRLHVVWFDTRDGNPEIYYKRRAGAQ